MPLEKVSLSAAFASFDEQWSPRLAADCNGQSVKLAKVEGAFVWHHHAADELFFVHRGELTIELRDDADVTLSEGELLVVPAGVEHRPVADGECEILLFEPRETRNTGDVEDERTVEEPERL